MSDKEAAICVGFESNMLRLTYISKGVFDLDYNFIS